MSALEELERLCQQCRRCSLYKNRRTWSLGVAIKCSLDVHRRRAGKRRG